MYRARVGRTRSAARSVSSSTMMASGPPTTSNVSWLCRAPGPGEALGRGAGVEVVHRGREEDDVPAVRDLGRQGHVLGALGAQVDGDLGAERMQDRAQRLSHAGAPAVGRQRELVVLPVVADWFAARDDLPDDVDVLPGALQRPGVRLAVPSLDHLRV